MFESLSNSYRNIIQRLIDLRWFILSSFILIFTACADGPCDDVNCFNGGVCDDGNCLCPSTYTGANCETLIVDETLPPSNSNRVRFDSIRLVDFPTTNNSSNWDSPGCGGLQPDIYLTIEDGTGIIYTSEVKENCVDGNSYLFTKGVPFNSGNKFSTFVIRLYDRDSTGNCLTDQYMAGIQGKLTNSVSEPQTSVLVSNPISEIGVELSLTYE